MRLLVINPNTTQAMTDAIGDQARAAAGAGTEIDAVSPTWGPASIEGHAEEVLAATAVLDVIARQGAATRASTPRASSRRSRSSASPRRRCSSPAPSPTASRS